MSRYAIAASLLLLSALPAFAQKRPVTADDVLGIKAVGSPMVSPDGTRVIYTMRQWETEKERMESRTRIWMVPAAGGAARQITFGERGDTQPQWSPDGRYISFVSARGQASGDEQPKAQVYLMRADGGEAWKLTDSKEAVASYSWSPDSTRIAFVATDPRSSEDDANVRKRDDERVFEGDFRYQHVWIIGVDGKGGATRVTSGTTYTVGGAPSWSPDGRRLAFSAKPTTMLRDVRSDVYIAEAAGGAVEKISTNPGPDNAPEWSPSGNLIAWIGEPMSAKAIGDGTYPGYVGSGHLMLYDVAAKSIKDASSRDFELDPGAPRWSPDGRSIVFVSGKGAYNEAFGFDVGTGKYSQLTNQKTLQFGSRSKDGKVVAVTMDAPDMPSEVHVTDAAFTSFRKLTDTNPQASAFALGETEVVTWKSSDGMEIEGVLLKPVGYTAGRRYPLLVVAHGGPSGAFLNNYRVSGLEGGHLWAGQGWAVFYPNPRGSTNYGEKFQQANINDWGGGSRATRRPRPWCSSRTTSRRSRRRSPTCS
jgi:dipeptidyl aminopeptidase/acylaminoacyl peptidase